MLGVFDEPGETRLPGLFFLRVYDPPDCGPLVGRSLGLEDTVRLLGFRQDVHAIIQAGNLFVLPSLAEPFGLVLLERSSQLNAGPEFVLA